MCSHQMDCLINNCFEHYSPRQIHYEKELGRSRVKLSPEWIALNTNEQKFRKLFNISSWRLPFLTFNLDYHSNSGTKKDVKGISTF